MSGAALGAGVSLLAAVLTEIYLGNVCACQEILRMEINKCWAAWAQATLARHAHDERPRYGSCDWDLPV
jgi:hypothetical protein